MRRTIDNLFIKDLDKEINSLIEGYCKVKTDAVKEKDWHMSGHYGAVLFGIKEVLDLRYENNMAQLIYSDLITLEDDELNINYLINHL